MNEMKNKKKYDVEQATGAKFYHHNNVRLISCGGKSLQERIHKCILAKIMLINLIKNEWKFIL